MTAPLDEIVYATDADRAEALAILLLIRQGRRVEAKPRFLALMERVQDLPVAPAPAVDAAAPVHRGGRPRKYATHRECLDARNAMARAEYQRRLDYGLCPQCGGPRPEEIGWCLCPSCRERDRLAQQAHVARRRREAN